MSTTAGPRGGVVEVVEPPGVLRQRELLDVRIAVKAHDRDVLRVAEGVADARGPGTIDVSAVREWIRAQSIDEFGRRALQHRRLRPELASRAGGRQRHENEADRREYPSPGE